MKRFQPIGKLPPTRSELAEASSSNAASKAPRVDEKYITLKPEDRYYDLIEREQRPSDVKSALAGALTGDLHRQGLLFDNMVDTWPRLMTNLEEVKNKVSKAPMKVIPYAEKGSDPTPEAIKRAEFVEDALLSMRPVSKNGEEGFQGLIHALATSFYTGHSVCEIYWQRDGKGYTPRAVKDLPWRFFGYPTQNEGEDRLMLSPNGNGSSQMEDFPEHQFICSVRKSHKGHATVAAPLRALSQYWLAETYGLKWLLGYAQIFGIPLRIANYTDNADLAKIEGMLKNLGSASWAALPDGAKIDIKEASTAAGNLPQKVLMDNANKACDIFLLGQSLTTDVGDSGSRALGDIHGDVRIDKLQAVADFCEDAINCQLVESIIRLNFGDNGNAPRVSIEIPRPKNEKGLVDRDKVLHVDMGLPVAVDELYARHGVKKPEEGAELFVVPSSASVTTTGDHSGRMLALWADRTMRLAEKLRLKGLDKKADILDNKVLKRLELDEVQKIEGSFRPSQKRAPSGQDNGGQWVSEEINKNNEQEQKEKASDGDVREQEEIFKNPHDKAAISRAVEARDGDGRIPEQRTHAQRERLRKLAEENPHLIIEGSPTSDVEETGEHNIIYKDDLVFKYTKGSQYGFRPVADFPDMQNMSEMKIGIAPSSPGEYLERMALHNKVFNDSIKLEGITKNGGLVISQPRITGRAATRVEVEHLFLDNGFQKIPEKSTMMNGVLSGTSFYHVEDQILVVDARPANVMVSSEGDFQVIDVMITKPDKYLEKIIEDAISPATKTNQTESARIEAMQAVSKRPSDEIASNVLKNLTNVSSEWLGGVKPFFDRLAALAQSNTATDEDFVEALKKSSKQIPELFDEIGTDKLQKAFDEALGGGVAAGIDKSLAETRA